MSENNDELRPETTQEPNSNPAPDLKSQIKQELKEELKKDFVYRKKKRLYKAFKFLIVFLLGLFIGFLAAHHHQEFRHGGYMMNDGHQMQHGTHMGHPNGS